MRQPANTLVREIFSILLQRQMQVLELAAAAARLEAILDAIIIAQDRVNFHEALTALCRTTTH
jgi:hypothetical protein